MCAHPGNIYTGPVQINVPATGKWEIYQRTHRGTHPWSNSQMNSVHHGAEIYTKSSHKSSKYDS